MMAVIEVRSFHQADSGNNSDLTEITNWTVSLFQCRLIQNMAKHR